MALVSSGTQHRKADEVWEYNGVERLIRARRGKIRSILRIVGDNVKYLWYFCTHI
jgi:hypothetical protein